MTGPVVIQLVALANGAPSVNAGEYILDYQPIGRGILTSTPDRARAKRFPDSAHAHAYWRQAHGVRSDGQPNRPLTAWTVEIASADSISLTDALR
jgi:hypothetical protein